MENLSCGSSFICMRIKKNFHVNCFALSLALKRRLEAPRKWPIGSQVWCTVDFEQVSDTHSPLVLVYNNKILTLLSPVAQL